MRYNPLTARLEIAEGPSVTGDVDGPASSTDNAVVRYDGTTGKLVQDSSVSISDDGKLGIGTASPGAKLNVVIPDTSTVPLLIESNDGTDILKLQQYATTDRAQLLMGTYNGVSNPNYSFVADTNTGIGGGFVADTLQLVTGGTERMRIDASGNVGVGSTPTTRFEVNQSTDGLTSVFRRTGATKNSGLFIYNYETGEVQLRATGSSGDQYMTFFASGTEAMRIANGGNVLIGTTTDVTSFGGAKLQVKGAGSTATTWYGRIIAGGDSKVFVMGQIDGKAVLGGHISNLSNWADMYINPAPVANTYIGNTASYGANTLATTVLSVLGTGNVGIGTAAPGAKLDISGISTSLPGIQIAGDSADQIFFNLDTYYTGAGRDFFTLRKARGTKASPTIVASGDYVGLIGWQAYDGAAFKDVAGIDARVDGTPGTNDTPGRLEFYTTPDGSAVTQTRMVIKNDGKVGINEAVPDYTLDVNGTFGFTPGSSVTPIDNGDVVIEATNDTTLTFKLKGSDGTVRTATLTLS